VTGLVSDTALSKQTSQLFWSMDVSAKFKTIHPTFQEKVWHALVSVTIHWQETAIQTQKS
jgi:hypothetical protein